MAEGGVACAPPRRGPRLLTPEEMLLQQIKDLRMLLDIKDTACRHAQEQSDHFQEQLAVVEQRATTAEATTAQLMSEKQADATRIASLEEQLEHAQQEQRNLHGYAQKLQMLVQELQRTHTTKQQQRAQSGGLMELLEPSLGQQDAPHRLALSVANSTTIPVAEAPETPDTERQPVVAAVDTAEVDTGAKERSWWFGTGAQQERRQERRNVAAMPT